MRQCIIKLTYRYVLLFFFNDTTTTEIYTLSLHDALPISAIEIDRGLEPGTLDLLPLIESARGVFDCYGVLSSADRLRGLLLDRKSTRLNSSHANISYAVFCLKKKNIPTNNYPLLYVYTFQ